MSAEQEPGEVCRECEGRGYLSAQPNERSTAHACPLCAGAGVVPQPEPEPAETETPEA